MYSTKTAPIKTVKLNDVVFEDINSNQELVSFKGYNSNLFTKHNKPKIPGSNPDHYVRPWKDEVKTEVTFTVEEIKYLLTVIKKELTSKYGSKHEDYLDYLYVKLLNDGESQIDFTEPEIKAVDYAMDHCAFKTTSITPKSISRKLGIPVLGPPLSDDEGYLLLKTLLEKYGRITFYETEKKYERINDYEFGDVYYLTAQFDTNIKLSLGNIFCETVRAEEYLKHTLKNQVLFGLADTFLSRIINTPGSDRNIGREVSSVLRRVYHRSCSKS